VLASAFGLALVSAATKFATGWLGAARAGMRSRGRIRAGVALIARGEFSVVIAGIAVATGAEPELAPLSAAYVLILAVVGPLLARVVDHLAPPRSRVAT
jgi:CPA2 family monovalent cation:H+ antiporter-2